MRLGALKFLVTGLALCVWAGATAASGESDLQKLQGTWVGVSSTVKGKPETKRIRATTMIVKNNTLTLLNEQHDDEIHQFKLDTSKKPKVMELTRNNETVFSIYTLEGDTFKMCFKNETVGPPPPVRCSSTKTDEQNIVVFKRKK